MFGMRRYRLFLFVAAVSALSVYYLSSRSSWNIADVERLSKGTFAYDSAGQHPAQDAAPEALPQTQVDDVTKPVEVAATRLRPWTSHSTTAATTTTSQSIPSQSLTKSTSSLAFPTTTGEELLLSKPDHGEGLLEEGEGRWEVEEVLNDGRKPTWEKPEAHNPLAAQDIIRLPSGSSQKLPKIQASFGRESSTLRKERLSKLNTIKESFKHAWNGYKQYGLPHDEVKPVSKSYADPFMGWGATLVDTLDTLWIMGLKQEFEDALLEVEKIDFKSSLRKDIPLFETVIRYLGGLIAAYDLSESKYPILLTKAEELAEILMGAFDTKNRMPITFYNWAPSYTSQAHRASTHATMAELGSLSVEMTRLAQITGKHEYYDAVARITDAFEEWQPETLMPGLWPLKVDASGCKKPEHSFTKDEQDNQVGTPTLFDDTDFDINGVEPAIMPKYGGSKVDDTKGNRPYKRQVRASANSTKAAKPPAAPLRKVDQEILAVDCVPQGLSAEPNAKRQTYGIGGQADSTYEYLPKMHQLLRGRNKQYESMYMQAARAIRERLLFRPMIEDEKREVLFVSRHDLNPSARSAKNRNIVTFEVTHLSCFVGGMFGLGAKLFGIEGDIQLAEQLTDGCVWAYESMPTGVMAETAAVVPCPDLDMCSWNETRWHEALDPNLEERLAAVEAWNANQESIYERSRREAQADTKDGRNEASALRTSTSSEAGSEARRRDVSDEQPSRTSPLDMGHEEAEVNGNGTQLASMWFVPKVALSHEKYVQARIQEERLPRSYTDVFSRHYGLRPEAIESVFYMYRITGKASWREKGWKMFEAVQSATQTDVANAVMKDVTSNLGELDDKMESFWLAETLKYFYLLFDEPTHISLDEWVLNTEAHAFKLDRLRT